MRAALERFAWRMWRGEAGGMGFVVAALLLPLEGLWRMVTRARNRRYDRSLPRTVEGLPVVSVGNVAVGGTGKTPLSAWVVGTLRDAGLRPGILMRGYGADEVELHRTWNPQVPVEVGVDRYRAAQEARAQGCDVAVLDDGFQHRALGRLLDVVLVAAEDPLPGAVLPRGPYREPLTALRRADVVVVTRRSARREVADGRAAKLQAGDMLSDGATVACVHLATDGAVPLMEWRGGGDVADGRPLGQDASAVKETHATPWDASGGVVVLSSVARPEAFEADVASLCRGGRDAGGGETELVAYPDHHDFTEVEARRARTRAGTRPIVITEKDAVKLRGFAEVLGDAWVVRQRLVWDRGEDDVRRRLLSIVGGAQEDER